MQPHTLLQMRHAVRWVSSDGVNPSCALVSLCASLTSPLRDGVFQALEPSGAGFPGSNKHRNNKATALGKSGRSFGDGRRRQAPRNDERLRRAAFAVGQRCSGHFNDGARCATLAPSTAAANKALSRWPYHNGREELETSE
ncbi:unnamed protein product [Lampetra planeri]